MVLSFFNWWHSPFWKRLESPGRGSPRGKQHWPHCCAYAALGAPSTHMHTHTHEHTSEDPCYSKAPQTEIRKNLPKIKTPEIYTIWLLLSSLENKVVAQVTKLSSAQCSVSQQCLLPCQTSFFPMVPPYFFLSLPTPSSPSVSPSPPPVSLSFSLSVSSKDHLWTSFLSLHLLSKPSVTLSMWMTLRFCFLFLTLWRILDLYVDSYKTCHNL